MEQIEFYEGLLNDYCFLTSSRIGRGRLFNVNSWKTAKNSKVKDYLHEKADQPAGIEDYGNNVKIVCVCVHIM